jgi:hypothetical protein
MKVLYPLMLILALKFFLLYLTMFGFDLGSDTPFISLFLPACGGNFHMGEGIFNSPGYPEIYPPNVECVWNIVSSPGNQLQLSFM